MESTWPGNAPLLQDCCAETRRNRIPALLGPNYVASEYSPLLHDLVRQYTPTRLHEISQTLFGAMFKDEPFWGIYEKLNCPTCGRELHVLLIDALMIETVDQLTRQLYDLIDTTCEDDVNFKRAADEQRARAGKIMAHKVFRTGKAPLITSAPKPGRMPQAWLTQAMLLAYVFMVIHETSHQGPQAALGIASYAPYLRSAHAGASLYGITLEDYHALAWAKELSADVNAFMIMVTDSQKAGLREEVNISWYRALIAGVSLAFKAWDLMLDEFCFGNAYLSRSLLKTHPPRAGGLKIFGGAVKRRNGLG